MKNVIERTVLLADGERLELSLPAQSPAPVDLPYADTPTLDEVQRRYIPHVLELTGGRIGGPGAAAEVMGMKRTSLYNRMKQLPPSGKPLIINRKIEIPGTLSEARKGPVKASPEVDERRIQ